jgi:predicted GH43/DUF377 family glycosyl hydrolase
VYVPREPFEKAKISGNYSGCEDPRLTKIGKRIYMCYTAFDGVGPPRVAVSSIAEADFLHRRFLWDKPSIITPNSVDDKDTCILPDRIAGKYLIIHRVGVDICADYVPTLDFSKHTVNKCIKILSPRRGMWDSEKVGITAPPIKTKKGWLEIYHGVKKIKDSRILPFFKPKSHLAYSAGAALFELKNPNKIIARSRSNNPLFYPLQPYEKKGFVNNVVFPSGAVLDEDNESLLIYSGGADTVTTVRKIRLKEIYKNLV